MLRRPAGSDTLSGFDRGEGAAAVNRSRRASFTEGAAIIRFRKASREGRSTKWAPAMA